MGKFPSYLLDKWASFLLKQIKVRQVGKLSFKADKISKNGFHGIKIK
jgi:ribosome-binding factor A